jgi:hypothetical protein
MFTGKATNIIELVCLALFRFIKKEFKKLFYNQVLAVSDFESRKQFSEIFFLKHAIFFNPTQNLVFSPFKMVSSFGKVFFVSRNTKIFNV